jgi:hypothetical protein
LPIAAVGALDVDLAFQRGHAADDRLADRLRYGATSNQGTKER